MTLIFWTQAFLFYLASRNNSKISKQTKTTCIFLLSGTKERKQSGVGFLFCIFVCFWLGALEEPRGEEEAHRLLKNQAIDICLRVLRFGGVFAGAELALCGNHRWEPVIPCAHLSFQIQQKELLRKWNKISIILLLLEVVCHVAWCFSSQRHKEGSRMNEFKIHTRVLRVAAWYDAWIWETIPLPGCSYVWFLGFVSSVFSVKYIMGAIWITIIAECIRRLLILSIAIIEEKQLSCVFLFVVLDWNYCF